MSLLRAVQTMVDAGVDFVIVGGWSAILHVSSIRPAIDLDLCYSLDAHILKRLADVLRPLHPRIRDFSSESPTVWDESMFRNITILKLSTDLGPIDLLAEVTGLGDFDAVKSRAILVEAFDRRVWTLDLPSLIRAKKASGRAKDLRALPELEILLDTIELES